MSSFVRRFVAMLAIVSVAFSSSSPLILVAHAAVTVSPATGGTAIPASSAGGAWTTLTGPVITENSTGDIGVGNIRLLAPAGFQFDTTGSNVTVRMNRVAGTGPDSCNINDLADNQTITAARTATVLSINISESSTNNGQCGGGNSNNNPVHNRLTWQNIRVRPISSSPLVSGIIRKGTNFIGGDSNFNFPNDATLDFGTLTMVSSVGTPSLTNSLVSVTPTSTVVGTNATIKITLKDASNNPVVGFAAGNVSISVSGTGNTVTPFPTSTVSNASGTLTTTLTSTVAEQKTITVTTLGVGGGALTNTATVTFVAGAPAKADIAASATSTVVGNPVTLTVSLKDAFDNVVADGSTATLTTSLGGVTGSSTTVAGVLTRVLNSTTTGVAALGVSSLVAPMTVTGVTSVQFLPDVPASLVITTQPSSTASVDSAFTTQPVMTVKDQYGNNVADGTIVTAGVETGTGELRNISTITSGGVATYGTVPSTQLGYSKSGEVFTIRFSAGAASAVSDALGPLGYGLIMKLIPVANPASLVEGGSSAITVYGEDQFGNTVTDNNTATGVLLVDNFASATPSAFTLSGGTASATLTKQGFGVVNVSTIATASSSALTGATIQVEFTKADTTAPLFVSSIPTNGATGVSVSTPLSLTFSEVLKASTVNSTNIHLVNASTSVVVPATVALVEGGTTVQITPASPLEYSTPYYFEATSGVTDAADNALAEGAVSSSTASFTTAENTADVTAPTVVSQYPDVAATGVSVSVVPTVTFSESMKASTLTSTSVGIKKVSDDSIVPATITIASGGTQAVITPNAALENSTSYYVFVTTDVTDEAGNALAASYGGNESSQFTTAEVIVPVDETAPVISGISATDITTSSVRIVWNTNEPATSQVEYGLTDAYGSITTLDTATTTAHSVVITGLLSNQVYHFRVRSTDEANNEAVSGDNTFATAFDDTAELHVTNITLAKSFALANDTFADGWRWVFDVTIPTIEQNMSMKFSDFVGLLGGTIPAANNVRIYSAESNNAADDTSAITITAADTYSNPLFMTSDRSSTTPGRQVQIVVEAKVPVGTPADSYSSNYGIRSEAPEIIIE